MLLFMLFITSSLYGNQNTLANVLLDTINIQSMDIVKVAGNTPHTKRIVLLHKTENTYYKIWPKDYPECSLFLRALELGFYDTENSSLIALIKDSQGLCRGYITKAGKPIVDKKNGITVCDVYDASILERNDKQSYVISSIAHQTNKLFVAFLEDLHKKIERTGIYYSDFKPRHIIFLDGRFRFIDLESLAPLSQVNSDFLNNILYPADYRSFVKRIAGKKNSG